MLSGHASARPCVRISRRPQLGPSGSTMPTLSLPSSQVPPSPPTGEPSRVTCSNSLEAKGVCDEWFVRPFQFDPFLRALDACSCLLWYHPGVRRARQCQELRVLALSARAPVGVSGWDTLFAHDTVDVLTPESGATALRSAFGSREQINARAWESARACDEMRSAIGSVDHVPTEVVLTRQCADVSELMYHMRINGDLLDQDLLVAFGGQSRTDLCERFAQRRSATPLLVAHHHRCLLRRAGPSHGALDRAPYLRRQSHHVSALGVHRGRPLQPRLWCPEPVHPGRV